MAAFLPREERLALVDTLAAGFDAFEDVLDAGADDD